MNEENLFDREWFDNARISKVVNIPLEYKVFEQVPTMGYDGYGGEIGKIALSDPDQRSFYAGRAFEDHFGFYRITSELASEKDYSYRVERAEWKDNYTEIEELISDIVSLDEDSFEEEFYLPQDIEELPEEFRELPLG